MPLDVEKPSDAPGLILEAWAQGYMVGSLIVMAGVAVANMRQGVLLHKLIVLELLLGTFHGTFIFTSPPAYSWYLSTTAILLNISWTLHNVVAWLKNKPFLGKKASMFYIGTVILVQPYWILEIAANFLYFGDRSKIFVYTRPWEALFRDPWWIFTVTNLFWVIKTQYDFTFVELVRVSPRFGVLLAVMLLSIAFLLVDVLAVTHVFDDDSLPDGINPFWKLAFVFRCLTDTIILDDFKTALDRLKAHKLRCANNPFSSGDFASCAFHSSASNSNSSKPAVQHRDEAVRSSREMHAAPQPPSQPQLEPSSHAHHGSCICTDKDDTEHIDLEAALREGHWRR